MSLTSTPGAACPMAVLMLTPDGHVRRSTVPTPSPGVDEVLVEVHAAGLDLEAPDAGSGLRLTGFAGRVAGFGGGDGEGRFVVGQPVYGISAVDRPEPPAEYVVVPSTSIAGRPTSVSDATASSVPAAALTAWSALGRLGRVGPGDAIVLEAAAGDDWVRYAVQFAALLGATVIVDASDPVAEDLQRSGAALIATGATRPSPCHVLTGPGTVPAAPEPELTLVAGLIDDGRIEVRAPWSVAVADAAGSPLQVAGAETLPVVRFR